MGKADTILASLKMYARFTSALYPYLRRHLTLDQAREIVQTRLRERETSFLHVVERSVFQNPSSLYLALLKNAGCEFGDLCGSVKTRGLEKTLLELRANGVYVSFEEFKGRAPIVRPGVNLPASAHHFDNPFLVEHFYAESSGSTGKSTRVPHDLDQNAALSPNTMLARAAFGALDVPLALWRGILPDGSGLNNILYPAYHGQLPEKWFSPFKPFGAKNSKYTLATYYFIALGRLYGAPVPFPEYVPSDQPLIVARWMQNALKREGKCLVTTTTSRALRVALAAKEEGIDLRGAWFVMGGEPMTTEKARGVTDSGARFIPTYAMSEAGRVGNGCANPLDVTDLHFQKDAFAMIPYTHRLDGFDVDVTTFHLTTLLPSASRLMLNVELDDYGIMEERACGCLWDELGFTTHLRGIRSYRKLTGEGVTLVGSDMIHILEHDLPQRFGGTPLDYQLLEGQDDKGLTRLYLVIHPRVEIANEQAVIDTVLSSLRGTNANGDATQTIWAQADSLRVKRMEPVLTERGKFSPLHVQRHVPPVA